MATTLNPEALTGIQIGTSVGSVAEWLRGITVRLIGAGRSQGSGVLWRSDGLIVTNAHVASGRVHAVEFNDGRRVQARVVARDSTVDLAALEVDLHPTNGDPFVGAYDRRDLPSGFVRSAHDVRTGEVVIAVGNPWDGEGAVTTGIVHRRAGRGACIFADIRLAPGNSGGPLADARGYVIGVNSAIVGGLGCAVTSDCVQEFLRRRALEAA